MNMRRGFGILCVLVALCAARLEAGDDDTADLRLRIAASEVLSYNWTNEASSDSSGRELGKPFTLSAQKIFNLTLILRGMPRRGDASPVAIRLRDLNYTDRRSIGTESKTEMLISKNKVKYTENGKVLMDSENDIGLDRIAQYKDHAKAMENGELRVTLDAAGRQSEMQGESALVDTFKNSGVQSVFPVLAGKAVKIGESWDDSTSMAQLGEFKLAHPAVIRSR